MSTQTFTTERERLLSELDTILGIELDNDFIIDDQDFELTPDEEARPREEVLKNFHKVLANKGLEDSIVGDKSDSTVFEN